MPATKPRTPAARGSNSPSKSKAAADPGPKYGGISSAAVEKATGCGWERWLAHLDRAGARKMNHKQIAQYLWDEHREIGGWWCQMVTVGYEQARGMRVAHQTTRGFTAGASRVIAVPIGRLYAAFADVARRCKWLGNGGFEVSSATPRKYARLKWSEPASRVALYFVAKGKDKSQIAADVSGLASAAASKREAAAWRARLDRLRKLLAVRTS